MQLLVAVQPDPRAQMQQKSLEAARKYEREATEHLRRIGIISASLEVTPGKKDVAGPPGEWYEDPRASAMLDIDTGVGVLE